MPNIKPISDLRNYSAVLEDVTVGSPVYLTKNGHGCYTIMDINEQEEMSRKARKYDKMVAELEVMKMLNEGLASANEEEKQQAKENLQKNIKAGEDLLAMLEASISEYDNSDSIDEEYTPRHR